MAAVEEKINEPTQAEVDEYIDFLEREEALENNQPRFGRVAQGVHKKEDPEDKQRIKKWMAACIITVSGFIDLIQALLTLVAIGAVLSPLISIGAAFLFWIWYQMLGVSYIKNPKKLAIFSAQSIVEIIPAIDVVPALTLGNILTILITRSEDKGGIIGKVANVIPDQKK